MAENTNAPQEENKKSKLRIILIIIGIALVIVGAGLIAQNIIATRNANNEKTDITQITQNTTVSEVSGVENPIDFKSWQSQNDEIFAWIKVPGTKVDYPILQSSESDDFYLKHRATDKQYSSSGAVYIQSHNSTELNDRVTVVYGHNGYGDTFFTTLHNFEKADFFKEHPYFYVYTPNRKLTYQIVSAFKYDDRHILNSFDFHSDNIFEEFIAMVQNPSSSNKNVRTKLDKQISTDDRLMILSTCITNQKSNRYLVCGVLVNDEQTL